MPHDPVLATDMENGVLRLNVGDFAADRIYTNNGADDPVDGDETIEIEILSDTEIRVRGVGPDFNEMGEWQTFESVHSGGFTKILAYADQGNDHIIILSDATTGTVMAEFYGGAGNDELQGGDAADLLVGDTGEDEIRGGDGNDVIQGGAGADCLEGEGGNDTIEGGDANDILIGGAGNDVMFAGDGDDIISGGAGNDTALGEKGVDLIAGGADDDVLMGNAGNDRIWGDQDFSFTVDCVLDLAGDGDEPLLTLGAPEGMDTISGGGGSDEIQGNGNNDRIWGDSTFQLDGTTFALITDGGGNPVLLLPEFGTFGNDNISGGAGDDTIFGEDGNDLIRGDHIRVDFEDDNNPFTWAEGNKFDDGVDDGQADGDDTIFSGKGSDIVYGNGGEDIVEGGTENDILFGNAGDDTLTGDVGADVIFGDNGLVQVFVAGDTVIGGVYGAVTQDFKLLRSFNAPGDGDDTINAGQDNDIIFGGGGTQLQTALLPVVQLIEDLILAGSGDDIAFGDHGQVTFTYSNLAKLGFATEIISFDMDFGHDDQMFGSTGRDVLIGGKGGDFVNGDDGFVVDPDSRDVVAGDHVKMTQVILLVLETPNPLVSDVYIAAPKQIVSIETSPTQGGNDTLDGKQDDDFLIGGPGDDKGTGGLGNDVLVGDRGQIDYDTSFIVAGPDYVFGKGELFVLQTVKSIDLALVDIPFTGVDDLSGGDGNDVVIGGGRGDNLFGDAEINGTVGPLTTVSDILVGDNGQVDYLQHGTLARVFTTDTLNATGGDDDIEANSGVDIAMGGVGGDNIWGDAATPGGTDADFLIEMIIGPLYLRLLVTQAEFDNAFADRVVDFALTAAQAG